MAKKFLPLILLIFWGLISVPVLKAAEPPLMAAPTGLSLLEIKITGNEFIMLQNNTGAAIDDLSRYWLYDFNNVNPLAAGVSSSTQQLPATNLPAGQTILLSQTGGSTCGAAVTAKLSVNLTDSGGFMEVVQTGLSNGVLVQTAGDAVSWSSGSNSSPGMISNVPSGSADPAGAYYRYQNVAGNPAFLWQPGELDAGNACQFNVKIGNSVLPGPSGPSSQLLPGSPPPATFIQADDAQVASAVLPPADIGLMAPQLNEILPNPASPQSDDEDEFIELYNANEVAFDLSGFKLEVGRSTMHDYTFAVGTQLPAKSFVAFYSVDTGLAMSNSGGQAKLLDPIGGLVSQSAAYGTAKDGESWALANGQWYWTVTPTPNAANIINLPLTTKQLSVGASSAAKTTKTATTKTTKPKATASKAGSNGSNQSAPAPANGSHINLTILAVIGALAVIYGLYEYRHDLANQLYRLRRYRAARRAARTAA